MKQSEKWFEKSIGFFFSVFIKLVILLTFYHAGQVLVQLLLTDPIYLISLEDLRVLLGAMLLILLVLELNVLVREYFEQGKIDVRMVLVILIIAFARKLLVIELDHTDGFILLGATGIIVGSAIAYWLVSKNRNQSTMLPK